MKYVKQRMSMRSGNARYSAVPGVSWGFGRGDTPGWSFPDCCGQAQWSKARGSATSNGRTASTRAMTPPASLG
jgi:hypothetical protein